MNCTYKNKGNFYSVMVRYPVSLILTVCPIFLAFAKFYTILVSLTNKYDRNFLEK